MRRICATQEKSGLKIITNKILPLSRDFIILINIMRELIKVYIIKQIWGRSSQPAK